jgi:hypothetical protein
MIGIGLEGNCFSAESLRKPQAAIINVQNKPEIDSVFQCDAENVSALLRDPLSSETTCACSRSRMLVTS